MTPQHFDRGPNLCSEFVAVLPVQHVALSTLTPPFDVETVCSSDAIAAELDELQIDLGEGPCWEALTSRKPVIAPELDTAAHSPWPTLRLAILARGIRAAYAFPLHVGSLRIGAVDLYATEPDPLDRGDIARATTMANTAALHVLEQALARTEETTPQSWPRRVVHQASGMVTAQLGVTPENALLLIRAHAFAAGRTVRDVAQDITDRLIDFSDESSTPQ